MTYSICLVTIVDGKTVERELSKRQASTPLSALSRSMAQHAFTHWGNDRRVHRGDGTMLGYYADKLSGECIVCHHSF